MNAVYLANSFHLTKTKSTDFLIELLRSWFNLTIIPHKEVWAQLNFKPDVLITFQHLWKPKELEAMGAKTTVIVPMFDDCPKDKVFWDSYLGFKILSFSSTLGTMLKAWGHDVLSVQYYPEFEADQVKNLKDYHGFFWPRTPQLDWSHIRPLLAGVNWKSFHLHVTNKEGAHHLPDQEEAQRLNLIRTEWFEKPEDYLKAMEKATVYFAPRRAEGIGQAVLEALARGLCVVAPDAPTMNEYITDGVDGILYDPDKPKPLDWSKVSEMGLKARRRAEVGRKAWLETLPRIREFISEPTPRRQRVHPWVVVKGKLIATARSLVRWLRKHH
ncbi:MAG: glycosyltransferase [Spirochaetales bacterium]|nr:glycosyltransferase [Spirochaetales bacterium]